MQKLKTAMDSGNITAVRDAFYDAPKMDHFLETDPAKQELVKQLLDRARKMLQSHVRKDAIQTWNTYAAPQ